MAAWCMQRICMVIVVAQLRRSDVAVRDAPPAAMMGLMESAHGLG
jgi:hypothetical protein